MPGSTLIGALVEAGGVTAQADGRLQIIRLATGRPSEGFRLMDDGNEIRQINLEDIRSGQLANVSLRNGDTVNVPAR